MTRPDTSGARPASPSPPASGKPADAVVDVAQGAADAAGVTTASAATAATTAGTKRGPILTLLVFERHSLGPLQVTNRSRGRADDAAPDMTRRSLRGRLGRPVEA